MSARHRRAQAARRHLWQISEPAHALPTALRGMVSVRESHPLATITDDDADKLRRLADRADAIAREVDALQADVFGLLTAYEATRGNGGES